MSAPIATNSSAKPDAQQRNAAKLIYAEAQRGADVGKRERGGAQLCAVVSRGGGRA